MKYRLLSLKLRLLGFYLRLRGTVLNWSQQRQNEMYYATVEQWLKRFEKTEAPRQ